MSMEITCVVKKEKIMQNKKDIQLRIEELTEEMKREKTELDYLAGQTIKMGRALSSDEKLLRQNEKVNALIVEEHQLKEMLKEFDDKA